MYESMGGAAGAGIGAATLPVTGLAIGWQLVLAATLVVAGVAVMRLVPRIGRRRG